MSSTSNSSFPFYLKNVSIYGGISIFIGGCLGGLLNIVVLLSLKTFRQNSCAFYLTVISFVNIGQLLTGLLQRIMFNGFGIDWSLVSPSLCKFFQYGVQVCALVSLTCLCLATIDQYLASCSNQRWQEWSSIQLAHRFCGISLIIWFIHGIPCLIYYNRVQSPTTKKFGCIITNQIFLKYFNYCYRTILTGCLPIFITILFGILSYNNVRKLSSRRISIVQRELDKQLTTMVLVLDIFNIIALMPYPIILVLTSVMKTTKHPFVAAQINFANNLTFYFYYLYFAVSISTISINVIFILFIYFFKVSILHIYLCIGTISATISLCTF